MCVFAGSYGGLSISDLVKRSLLILYVFYISILFNTNAAVISSMMLRLIDVHDVIAGLHFQVPAMNLCRASAINTILSPLKQAV